MPSFIITFATPELGATIDALHCDPGTARCPDRRHGVQVKVTIGDQRLTIDNEAQPRNIFSTVGRDGKVTYLVDGNSKGTRNRKRRVALERASARLEQLATTLRPLMAESAQPGLATEGLGLLFNWIHDEREYAMGVLRDEQD